MGKFLRHFWNICTIKSWWRILKDVMTLNCTHGHTLVSGGSSLLKKIINQQNHNHWFLATFRVLSLPEKKFYRHIFFKRKPKFSASPRFPSQVFKNVFWGLLTNRDIQWIKLTKRPYNHTNFYIFWNFSGVRKWLNSSSGSDETKLLIYKVPFTLHPLVELIHNTTNAKEQKKIRQVNAFNKERQS